jgi:hypothetical protein
MQKNKPIQVSFCITLLIFFVGSNNGQDISTDSNPEVFGRILAVHREGVIFVYDGTVTLRSGSHVYTTKVNNRDGSFDFRVPAGIYTLTMEARDYFSYKRAPFNLGRGQTLILNIRPVPHAISYGQPPDPVIEHDEMQVTGQPQLFAVVRYEHVAHGGERTVYSGGLWTMLSYDSLSVYAKKFDCNSREAQCIAEGDVIVETQADPKLVSVFFGTRAEIDLANRKLTLTREPQIQLKF